MKYLKFVTSIISLFVLVQISSCKKDGPQPSKSDLLSKTWKITALSAGGIDILSSQPACQNDDLITFTKDGKYSVDEGPTKCNATDPQIEEMGTWSFQNNQTKLVVTPTVGNPQIYTIISLSSTTLKANYTATSNGVTVTLTITFTAQ